MKAADLVKDIARCQSKENLVRELHRVTGAYLQSKSEADELSVLIITQAYLIRAIADNRGQTKTDALLADMDKIYKTVTTPSEKN